MFKLRSRLLFASLLAVLGLLPLACSGEESFSIDNTCKPPVPCDADCDCYTDGNSELGTLCRDGQCLCPDFEGMSKLPCCKKGSDPLDCQRQCRPVEECEPELCQENSYAASASSAAAGGGGGSGGSGGSGGAGGSAGTPGMCGGTCASAADCPGPVDSACGKAECVNGACQLTINVGPRASQKQGDCKVVYCDPLGALIVMDDPSDVYNDGKQCTFDVCQGGELKALPYPNGFTCPEVGVGVCFDGDCVPCYNTAPVNQCNAGLACDGTRCVPSHCINFTTDPMDGETDYNCGGPCNPCPIGYGCKVPQDCYYGVCFSGICQQPSCNDGVTNDGETGVDCGGPPSCKRCPDLEGCKTGDDCLSGVCWTGVCQAPRCDDGVKNGDEIDIDCGGPSCDACPNP